MRQQTIVLAACVPFLVACTPPFSSATRNPGRATVVWSDTIDHQFDGVAIFARCGTDVAVQLTPEHKARSFPRLWVTISPFREKTGTLDLAPDFISGDPEGEFGWAHADFYDQAGAYVGAIAGYLTLVEAGRNQIGGRVKGSIASFDPREMGTDTVGSIEAHFDAPRSHDLERIAYQMVTCPADSEPGPDYPM